jgi:hypothetical protein
VDATSNSCENGSHEPLDRWPRDDKQWMASEVLGDPTQEFLFENMTLDAGQLKMLAAGKPKFKYEKYKAATPHGVASYQSEAIVVEGSFV